MDAIVLLGWMTREVATTFLREQCVFGEPLSAAAADELWSRQRLRVDQLPERRLRPPEHLPLSSEEEAAVERFLEAQSRVSGGVTAAVKVDPFELAARQLGVTVDRRDRYARLACTRTQWILQWLNPAPTPIAGRVRASVNAIDVELPHAEFLLHFDQQQGFRVVEAARYVSVTLLADRTMLMTGYHRVCGYQSSDAAEADRSVVAAVVPATGPDSGSPPCVVMDGAEELCARRPPMVADFFDDRLALRVKMRPRRYELQVRARMAAVPENHETRQLLCE